jgi:hypothetical protein
MSGNSLCGGFNQPSEIIAADLVAHVLWIISAQFEHVAEGTRKTGLLSTMKYGGVSRVLRATSYDAPWLFSVGFE